MIPEDPTCREHISGAEVPCRIGAWRWVQGWSAYARLADPQPPESDPVWKGNTEGAIYDRGLWLGDPDLDPGIVIPIWQLTPPWESVPDPREMAVRAVAQMDLRAVTIGIVPEDTPGSVGLVGLPTWMWVEDPAGNTVGPISRTVTEGAYSVTATATVESMEWDMGDGSVVTCQPPGTPYQDSYQDSDSPTCGHRYSATGRYPVTATSEWVVTWSGLGQSGVITFTLQRDTELAIGEAQVLSQMP